MSTQEPETGPPNMKSFSELPEEDVKQMDLETLRYYAMQVIPKEQQINKPKRPSTVQMCSNGTCEVTKYVEDVEDVEDDDDDVIITKEFLKNMLRRENELRLSDETQKKYMEAEKKSEADWINVTLELQRQVVREFGIRNIDRGVHAIQSAYSRYGATDSDFFEIPLYVRYNRARQGDLKEGEPAVNISKLFHVDDITKTSNLFDFAKPAVPLVVLAGSYT